MIGLEDGGWMVGLNWSQVLAPWVSRPGFAVSLGRPGVTVDVNYVGVILMH